MSGMPGSGRKYGVQVGNETYSLILTQEDWEKRRQDRENARKLSLANNKRRRALDDRRRVAEVRENRKRELELFKRRQRQIEATERYQRFHISVKDKRTQNSNTTENVPNLEEVLQKLQGGDGDGVTEPAPTAEKPSVTNVNKVKLQSESNQTSQPINLERAQWQNMKEYAEDIKRQILGMRNNADDDLKDSLETSQDGYIVDDDGQDSLHGSSISGSSQPSYSSLTLTKGNVDTAKPYEQYSLNTNSLVPPETSISEPRLLIPETPPVDTATPNGTEQNVNVPNGDFLKQQNNFAIIRGSETGVLCKRDSHTGRITYYVKAYRPWSASIMNKPFQNTFSHANGPAKTLLRPSSSYEAARKGTTIGYSTVPKPPQKQDAWIATSPSSGYIMQHSKKFSDAPSSGEIEMRPMSQPKSVQFSEPSSSFADAASLQQRRATSAPIGRTTATPVTTYYENATPKTSAVVIPDSMAPLVASAATNFGYASQPISENTESKVSSTAVMFSPNYTVPTPSNQVPLESEKHEDESTNKPAPETKQLKGILRRHSKYDSIPSSRFTPSHPSYQSAGVARQKWLQGINLGPPQLDPNDAELQPRVRSAEAKSVRWHQVQYNDGTSSALDGQDNVRPPPPTPAPKPQPPTRASPRIRSPKKPSVARPKTSPSRGMRGGKVKTGGRRLRPAKEVPINIVPHPPQKQTPKLTMSTVVNYSIDPEENMPPQKDFKPSGVNSGKAPMKTRPSSSTKRMSPITHNKIVFHRKSKPDNGEAVTMSTLKSRGNDPRMFDGRNIDNVVVSQGNQVTINVSSSKPIMSVAKTSQGVTDSGRIPLNGTPTDQEIEMLWDKVRAYLEWNKNRGNSPLVKKMRGPLERKVAWSAPQPEPPAKQVSANIISIDGGIFSKNPVPEETPQHQIYKFHHTPVHYERFGIAKSRKVAYSPTVPSQGYGYTPNHGPQFQMREKVRGAIPVMSNVHPSSAPVRRQTQLTDSVKTFRLVEALIEQNVPEEEILKALNSLQSATREV